MVEVNGMGKKICSFIYNMTIIRSLYNNNPLKADTSVEWAGLNPLTAKLFNLNFHPLEVVSR